MRSYLTLSPSTKNLTDRFFHAGKTHCTVNFDVPSSCFGQKVMPSVIGTGGTLKKEEPEAWKYRPVASGAAEEGEGEGEGEGDVGAPHWNVIVDAKLGDLLGLHSTTAEEPSG